MEFLAFGLIFDFDEVVSTHVAGVVFSKSEDRYRQRVPVGAGACASPKKDFEGPQKMLHITPDFCRPKSPKGGRQEAAASANFGSKKSPPGQQTK